MPGGSVWLRRARCDDLRRAVSLVATDRKRVLAGMIRPVIFPDDPSQWRQRRAQLRFSPWTVVHLHFNLRYSSRSSMRDAANRYHFVPVSANDRHVYSDSIDDRRRMHLREFIPAAPDPVARFPMIGSFNRFDPFGLFHTVEVGDIDPEWIAMLPLERYAVPPVGQHDPRIRLDRFQRNHLKKAVGRADFQMGGTRRQLQVGKQSLQAHPCPACSADQIAAHRVRDTR